MKNTLQVSQNFLRDPRLVEALIAKTNINSADIVYDIGGGQGLIASVLAAKCRAVICVEMDADLVAGLRKHLKIYANVVVYGADFLALPLPVTPYKVFANIPFNLSADIVRKLTGGPYVPTTSYLIVQKEFAEKLLSRPGAYNSQSAILIGIDFDVKIIHQLNPADFHPKPRVTPVLLVIAKRPKPLLGSQEAQLFKDFVAYAYNSASPTVMTSLARLFSVAVLPSVVDELRIPVSAKPSQLDLRQWLLLFSRLACNHPALERLVGGYQAKLITGHYKHSRVHRTRPDKR